MEPEILNNLKDIKCFPIFVSKEIYHPKNKNIFLIGMMCAGKTTIGKLLSEKLNMSFFDTDCEIE